MISTDDMHTVQLSSGQLDQYGNQTLYALRSDGSIWRWTQYRVPYGMDNQCSMEESWTRLKDIPEPVLVPEGTACLLPAIHGSGPISAYPTA